METVLKAFPFQLICRGVFPGGFFVVSYIVASKGWCGLKNIDKDSISSWLLTAVFSGVMVYILHRSLLYPLVEYSFDRWYVKANRCKCRKCCPPISKRTTVRRLAWWSTGERKFPDENIASHLTTWNDYVHLQYASGLCIISGAICAWNCGTVIRSQVFDCFS